MQLVLIPGDGIGPEVTDATKLIVAAAGASFVDGLHVVAVVAAVVILVGAVAVARWLPARARDEDAPAAPAEPEPESVGVE